MKPPPSLDADFRHCYQVVRHQDPSLALAGRFLAPDHRRAFAAICAWCWRADNLLDDGPQDDLAGLDRRHARLVADLDDVYAGRCLDLPEARALHHTVGRYAIPKRLFDRFLEGIGMDRRTRRYQTFEQLLVYCRAVLSPVTVLSTHVFGYRGQHTLEYASLMGVAMQLTNICRDVGNDYARGRIYLPAEERSRFAVSERDLAKQPPSRNFVALMRFQLARARRCYAEAERGIPNIADRRGRFAALAIGRVYALKLDALQRDGYDCLTHQPRVATTEKLAAVARAGFDLLTMPSFADLPPAPNPADF